INLNALLRLNPNDKDGKTAKQILMALPNMTDDVADSILDWLDPDDDPRPNGAESNYYSALGYSAKNGPMDSLDELLMVKGVTAPSPASPTASTGRRPRTIRRATRRRPPPPPATRTAAARPWRPRPAAWGRAAAGRAGAGGPA